MTDWDLLTPGIGLSVIGIVGVAISLSGLSKTFIDGMHAVSLLTFFLGTLFLVPGLFKDGFPSSRRAKNAAFVTLGILISIGVAAAISTSVLAPSIFLYIGVMILIGVPAIAIVVGSHRNSPRLKILYCAFIGSIALGLGLLYAVGNVLPQTSAESTTSGGESGNATTPGQDDKASSAAVDTSNYVPVSILAGSSAQGNPSYDPADLEITSEPGIVWTNNDNVPHTVTSLKDDGKTFDSSIMMQNDKFSLDVSNLPKEKYEYFCTVHPYMKASFTLK